MKMEKPSVMYAGGEEGDSKAPKINIDEEKSAEQLREAEKKELMRGLEFMLDSRFGLEIQTLV